MRARRPADDPSAAAADAALERIYLELAVGLGAATCPRSTRCCRFRTTGRTPYLWPVEARRVLRAVGRIGGKLPEGGEEGDCPLIKRDGTCSIYADRPFGCRTFFCGDAFLPNGSPRATIEGAARRLRAIADREGELLPLTTILRSSGRPPRSRRA